MDDSFPVEPFEKLGYSVEVYGQKSYNGVAIISKIKPENVKKGFYGCNDSNQNFEIFLDQKRLISADINGIKIINVYVPNGSSLESSKFQYKINWLNCLASFLDYRSKCLPGKPDLKELPLTLFLSCLHKLQLVDPHQLLSQGWLNQE